MEKPHRKFQIGSLIKLALVLLSARLIIHGWRAEVCRLKMRCATVIVPTDSVVLFARPCSELCVTSKEFDLAFFFLRSIRWNFHQRKGTSNCFDYFQRELYYLSIYCSSSGLIKIPPSEWNVLNFSFFYSICVDDGNWMVIQELCQP